MDYTALMDAVFKGDQNQVVQSANALMAAGADPARIINEGLIPGMNKVGVLFKAGEMFVPEVMRCAKAMHAGINLVKPLIMEKDIPSLGTVVIGTVKGDLHDIGKNLVIMMLESSGYKVVDLGMNVPPEGFVRAVVENKPAVLGMSALLTTTMVAMKETLDALEAAGVRNQVKVIIGGAPVSQNYAREIGADGYAPDAAAAVDVCKELTA